MLSMSIKTQISVEYLFGSDHEIFKRWSEEEIDLGFIEINEILLSFFHAASHPSLNFQ